ncbi:MAG TPA: radical SAM protein [Magnetovibrio sp.]
MSIIDIYDMPLWRPPSEGQNLIIQATLGCSFNACTFCAMYKTKDYRAKTLEAVGADIDAAAADWPDAHRVFLADGDALTLPTDHLMAILAKLRAALPELTRVSCYATPLNLNKKSVDELSALRAAGLSLVYLGIESGADDILKRIHKGSASAMESALKQAADAGIKVSATVILGLGGKDLWREHIEQTAALINRQPPTYLSTLQLGLDPELEPRFTDAFAKRGGAFEAQDDVGALAELELLLQRLAPPKPVIFRSNHASNCLPLAGTLPKDTVRLLAAVRDALAGHSTHLRPQKMRGF